ncbi:MAG TPA: hypothetical protein VKS21_06270, partial [Spirochaetota bacterium]|nr:hypothetical protein [Spirochaetota bacterium]
MPGCKKQAPYSIPEPAKEDTISLITRSILLFYITFIPVWSNTIKTKGQNLVRVSVFPVKAPAAYKKASRIIYDHYLHDLQKASRFHIIEKDKVKAILNEYSVALAGFYQFDENNPPDLANLGFADYFIIPVVRKIKVSFLSKHTSSSRTTNSRGEKTISYYLHRKFRREFHFYHRLLNTRRNKIDWSDTINILDEYKTKHLIRRIKYRLNARKKMTKSEKNYDPPELNTELLQIKKNMISYSIAGSISDMFRAIDFLGTVISAADRKNIIIDIGKKQGIKGNYNVAVRKQQQKEIIHPVTGKKIAVNKPQSKTILQITDIGDDYSITKIVKGNPAAVKTGDEVKVLNKPVFRAGHTFLNLALPGTGFFIEKKIAAAAVNISFSVIAAALGVYYIQVAKDRNILDRY